MYVCLSVCICIYIYIYIQFNSIISLSNCHLPLAIIAIQWSNCSTVQVQIKSFCVILSIYHIYIYIYIYILPVYGRQALLRIIIIPVRRSDLVQSFTLKQGFQKHLTTEQDWIWDWWCLLLSSIIAMLLWSCLSNAQWHAQPKRHDP